MRLEPVSNPTVARTLGYPLLALGATVVIGSLLAMIAGADPFAVLGLILRGAAGSKFALLETLNRATPLIFTGLAIAVAFRAKLWNIGAEAQLYAGAVMAALLGTGALALPSWALLPLMAVMAMLAGALVLLGPALLKVRFGVDEVVTTLLLNSVALLGVSALLNGPWRDPVSQWPQSPEIAAAAMFPKLIPRSRLHLGFLLAIVIIVVMWFVLSRTAFGLRMRAVGMSPNAARFAGIKVERTLLISALVSGGIAGLAGVSEVAGIHFHLIDAISGGNGYTGIIVATLGGLNPWGAGLAALFIGVIDTGSQSVSRALGVPVYLGDVILATLLLVTLAMLLLQRYRVSWKRSGRQVDK